jgi:hypothetical protein
MIATLAALHLLAVGQTKLVDGAAADPAAQTETSAMGVLAAAQPAPQGAPAPAQPPAEAPLAQAGTPAPPLPQKTRPSAAPTQPPQQVSLFSADTLHGTSYSTAWAGWPSFGAMYGQGITDMDDIGALFSFDYSSTEMRLGGWYRRPLGTAESWQVGGRLGVNWYADFGTHWYHTGNHGDRGVELVPALLFSNHAAGGIFTLEADLPITVTLFHEGGFAFQPQAAVTYETALYREMTVGIRGALWYRAGSGGAPMKAGHGGGEAVVVVGYRLF